MSRRKTMAAAVRNQGLAEEVVWRKPKPSPDRDRLIRKLCDLASEDRMTVLDGRASFSVEMEVYVGALSDEQLVALIKQMHRDAIYRLREAVAGEPRALLVEELEARAALAEKRRRAEAEEREHDARGDAAAAAIRGAGDAA